MRNMASIAVNLVMAKKHGYSRPQHHPHASMLCLKALHSTTHMHQCCSLPLCVLTAGAALTAGADSFLSDLATVMLGSGAQITITGPALYPSPDQYSSTTMTMDEYFARPPLAPAELLTAVHVPFAPYAMHASNNPSSKHAHSASLSLYPSVSQPRSSQPYCRLAV